MISDFRGIAYIPQSMDHLQLEQHLSDYIYHDANIAYFDYNYFFQVANQLNFDCDLLEKEHLHLKNLSGGERLKIQLMKALAYHPQLLLLDEPTADLDSLSLDWLESFIKSSPQTIIFISHDQHFIQKVATSILHLELVRKDSCLKLDFILVLMKTIWQNDNKKTNIKECWQRRNMKNCKREAKFKKSMIVFNPNYVKQKIQQLVVS
ncbi:ATP-binding cassette domain-containing protein [Streptococcus iniae]